jgi:hypothetical protein
MKPSLKFFVFGLAFSGLAACSSGQKSTKDIQTRESKTTVYPVPSTPSSSQVTQTPAVQAGPPVIVTPRPTLSGGTTGTPMNQGQMQGMMDQCMSLQKDTSVCSQRLMQDCQVSTSPSDCQNMMKNVKVLRGQ